MLILTFQCERTLKNLNLSVYEVWNIRCHVCAIVRITVQYSGHGDKSYDKNLTPSLKLVNVLICNDPLLNIGYICSLNKCMTLHITQLNYVFKCFERTCSKGKCASVCKACCMQSIWWSMYHCAWSGHSETFHFINPNKTCIFLLLLLDFCSVELWLNYNLFVYTVCIHIV